MLPPSGGMMSIQPFITILPFYVKLENTNRKSEFLIDLFLKYFTRFLHFNDFILLYLFNTCNTLCDFFLNVFSN